MKNALPAAALMLAAALTLTACGDDPESTSQGDETSTESAQDFNDAVLGDICRLALANRARVRLVGVLVGAQDDNRRTGCRFYAMHHEPLVRRLGVLDRLDQLSKHGVDPVENRRRGAEVGGQVD